MKYHQIAGTVSTHSTGVLHNCEAAMQDGFDLYESSGPIDAPEAIPSGAIVRIEWTSHTNKNTRSWFPAHHITLRSYQ